MVAIEPILENIKRKLKTDDVRLPTATEIERQTVSFKATNGEVSNELDEETRAPTSEVNQTKTSGKSPQKPCKVQEWSTQRNTPELPSTEDRHLLGEPRTEDGYYYPFELPEHLVDMSHLLDQQEDKSLNEKSPVQDGAPQTPIVQPSLPHGTVSHKDKESRGLAIGQAAPVALTSIHNSYVPSISNPLVRFESQSVGISNTTVDLEVYEPGSSMPRTQQWKVARAITKIPIALLLSKTISLPYKTWHFLETVVLRTEYRRRMRGRRLYRHLFRPIWILSHLGHPGDYSVNIHTAILNDIQISWYYVCLPLFIVGEVLLNILYFVVCFPFIFWVAHRHRDVLTDVRTLERQQRESIEMLGRLLDRYNDHELLEQRSVLERLLEQRSVLSGAGLEQIG